MKSGSTTSEQQSAAVSDASTGSTGQGTSSAGKPGRRDSSQTPTGIDLLAAAVSYLTGQTPTDGASSSDPSGTGKGSVATTAAASTTQASTSQPSTGQASTAPASPGQPVAASPAGDASAASTGTDTELGTPTATGDTPAGAAPATTGTATGTTPTAAAPAGPVLVAGATEQPEPGTSQPQVRLGQAPGTSGAGAPTSPTASSPIKVTPANTAPGTAAAGEPATTQSSTAGSTSTASSQRTDAAATAAPKSVPVPTTIQGSTPVASGDGPSQTSSTSTPTDASTAPVQSQGAPPSGAGQTGDQHLDNVKLVASAVQSGVTQSVPSGTSASNTGQSGRSADPSSTAAAVTTQAPPTSSGSHAGIGNDAHGDTASPGSDPSAAGQPSTAAGSTGTGATTFSVATPLPQAADAGAAAQRAADSLPRGLVTLPNTPDAVRATFTAMNQAGVSTARITLSPESLGGIRISLSQTSQGVVARVIADHPEATQTLQQNAAELKRSLEASGVNLLRLDISSSGQQSLSGFRGSGHDANGSGSSGQGSGDESANADAEAADTGVSELTVQLASGSLVDVLA